MSRVGLGERLISALFPARCLMCDTVIPAGELFCRDCVVRVPEKPFSRKFALTGAGAEGFRVLSPLSYEGGTKKSIHRLKFYGRKGLAKPMGKLMAETARDTGVSFDAVTWVPMTGKKRKQRGYDQSELLAKAAAKELGLPCLPLLKKVRENQTQHELSGKQRWLNVKNAYRAGQGAQGKVLLLIDDIVTTGATVSECAKTLYAAGAKTVTGVCAADAAVRLEGEKTA